MVACGIWLWNPHFGAQGFGLRLELQDLSYRLKSLGMGCILLNPRSPEPILKIRAGQVGIETASRSLALESFVLLFFLESLRA